MKFDLWDSAKEHRLIVAHRGTAGGNIPCNTLTSYEIALKQGADMIEVDVSRSKDDKLFLFHPGMECEHLNQHLDLSQMALRLTKNHLLRYINVYEYLQCHIQHHL